MQAYNVQMTIRERARGDVVVLDVDGNLSASDSVRSLRVAVEALLRDDRTRIILNMERVLSVDSTGLADLLEVYHATSRRGGSLKLAHLTPRVRELLALTTLLKVLEVFDSEADALASFATTSSHEPYRIHIDGVKDPAVAEQTVRAIRATLSTVHLPGVWTIRLAPVSTNEGQWVLTIDNARAHHETAFATEREALCGVASQMVQAFPSLMAALNAATTIT